MALLPRSSGVQSAGGPIHIRVIYETYSCANHCCIAVTLDVAVKGDSSHEIRGACSLDDHKVYRQSARVPQ